ncbi:MAG: preprotein translocase subunit YajC [Holosporaceae bacterium]|nr:preprotein translocase subunit YajC [Holosporaceae bacterium]
MNANTEAQTTGTSAGTTGGVVEAAPEHNLASSLMLPFLILVAFYFLLMRPQQKRETKRRNMVNSLKRGDRVVTAGGILGSIHKIIGEKEVSLEVAEGVRLRMLKSAVGEVLGGEQVVVAEPVDAEDSPPAKKKKK